LVAKRKLQRGRLGYAKAAIFGKRRKGIRMTIKAPLKRKAYDGSVWAWVWASRRMRETLSKRNIYDE
jgi:hypothetical protein